MESRVGFWPRAGAYVLDMAAVWAVGLALQGSLAKFFPGAVAVLVQEMSARPDTIEARPFLEWTARLGVATTLIAPFYGLIEALRGYSPGKLALGLRIVAETGQKAPLSTLLLRFAIKGSAAVVAAIGMLTALKSLNVLAQAMGWATTVGCFLVLTRERTAMHDRIAGTAVLRKADMVVPAPPSTSSLTSS